MNEQDRAELELLKRKIEALHSSCSQAVLGRLEQLQRQQETQQQEFKLQTELLGKRIQQLEARLRDAGPAISPVRPETKLRETPVAIPEPVPAPRPSPPTPPPIIPPVPTTEVLRESVRSRRVAEPVGAPSGTVVSNSQPGASIPAVPAPLRPAALSERIESSSFELRLGTFWLVRIGIVMLLTGLVFFGNYAYQNFIGKLGPGGKVALLYLASGILLGVGAWLQRRQVKESLKNYGQVVFAGGLAAVYFTTYAAHYLPQLRVISSALADGVLLFAWAACIVGLADWRKSEVLALFAICLAYYASIISEVKAFTLFSNLVLTLAAVFFLVRNRWAKVSFVSLVATYLGYAFWRFYNGADWIWATPLAPGDYRTGALFLLGYWTLFTAAVFLSRAEALTDGTRATFLTFNNGAYFVFAILTSAPNHPIPLWSFTLAFGAVLLALAFLSRRVLPGEDIVKSAYLTQGLVFATLGVIFKFTGGRLGLVLAAESVVLLILGTQRRNLILQAGAYVAAALASGWGVWGVAEAGPSEWSGLGLGAAIGALLVFNAVWLRRQTGPSTDEVVCPKRSCFTLLGLGVWLMTTHHFAAPEFFGLILAAEALALTASYYVIRVPEVTLFSQGYLMLAQVYWLSSALNVGEHAVAVPWWNPVLMIAVTLTLSHWWQRQRVMATVRPAGQVLQGLYGLAVVGVLYCWLSVKFGAPSWLALTSLLAIGVTVYGALTRAWLLAAAGQLFLAVSAVQFVRQLFPGSADYAPPFWPLALAPVATCLLLPALATRWLVRQPQLGEPVAQSVATVGLIYRAIAVLMSLQWVHAYIPSRERFWVLAVLGGLVFLWGGWRRNPSVLGFSAVYSIAGLWLYWSNWSSPQTVYGPNLLAILLLLGQQQIARRFPAEVEVQPEWHGAMMIAGGLSLWLFVSRLVLQNASGFYLTASWAVLALVIFAAGFGLRERIHRWLGLAVLAGALGRVVIFDVWKLETIYRILSFMALGIVLLILGFIYTKYQEKIREWL